MLESRFVEDVRDWLEEEFPSAEIESEVYLDSERYVDFVVDFGRARIMVEVENKADDVAEGIGQAQMYAWSDERATAMVVYPSGTGTVEPEVLGMSPTVGVVEVTPSP